MMKSARFIISFLLIVILGSFAVFTVSQEGTTPASLQADTGSQQPTASNENPVRDSEKNIETATFAAGCFWGVEAAFRKIEGVVETTVGYTGGTYQDPTYKIVCTGRTGHAEAVQVKFDPSIVSYNDLLNVFWEHHDPTTLNRQGPDAGTQYRSVIFYHTPGQERLAKASKTFWQLSGKYRGKIVTEIVPAAVFYKAEEYHQRYLEKRGLASCKM